MQPLEGKLAIVPGPLAQGHAEAVAFAEAGAVVVATDVSDDILSKFSDLAGSVIREADRSWNSPPPRRRGEAA